MEIYRIIQRQQKDSTLDAGVSEGRGHKENRRFFLFRRRFYQTHSEAMKEFALVPEFIKTRWRFYPNLSEAMRRFGWVAGCIETRWRFL